MTVSKNIIITIDVSTYNVKVGFVNEDLKLDSYFNKPFSLINDDPDGFAKSIDMEDLWNKITSSITYLLEKHKSEAVNIIGISSCAQRIACVFLDKQDKIILGSPNDDIRGIDSAYLIEDEFTEEDLFKITGHSPTLLFGLARLLWIKEEQEELYEKIDKFLSLDDWIVYRLTGNCVSDSSSASDSQMFDVIRGKWSSEIIEAFDLNPEIFPDIVDTSSIVGCLKSKLSKQLNLKQKEIPVIKTGGDTQASLIGMGVVEPGDIGITLGTTAPIHLVINKPKIDSNLNFWTTHHSIKGNYLIEANTGKTGKTYDWFKDAFLEDASENQDLIIETYLKKVEPGADSTFAFLGPQLMDFKNQTDIKRGVFIFQPPSTILEELPKKENFAKAVIENIGFGIYENYQALKNFINKINKTFCAGGMAKSKEFCKILTNILNTEISVPQCKDSAFIGMAMNTLIGLKYYSNHKSIVNKLLKFDKYLPEPSLSKKYKNVYIEWKNLKKKLDDL